MTFKIHIPVGKDTHFIPDLPVSGGITGSESAVGYHLPQLEGSHGPEQSCHFWLHTLDWKAKMARD